MITVFIISGSVARQGLFHYENLPDKSIWCLKWIALSRTITLMPNNHHQNGNVLFYSTFRMIEKYTNFLYCIVFIMNKCQINCWCNVYLLQRSVLFFKLSDLYQILWHEVNEMTSDQIEYMMHDSLCMTIHWWTCWIQ